MNNKVFISIFLIICLIPAICIAEMRSWTGSNGKTIEAEFVRFDSEKEIVTIRLKNGKENRVRLELFSDKDREFVVKISNTDNPFGDDNSSGSPSKQKLSPGSREKQIGEKFLKMLNEEHVSGKKFDKKMAERAFDAYIESLDPLKVFFLQSDIEGFRAASRTLPEKLEQGDMTIAFNVYNRYLQRIDEAVNIVLEILEKPLDFNVDEEYIIDKESISFVKNKDELADRWRKRLKYEILQLKSNKDENSKERLKRRYESLRKRMFQTKNDDVLESFLTAIGSSFDIHSNYLSPRTMDNFKMMMEKKLEGIGATLTQEDGYTIVKKLVPGGPAQKSSELEVEDKIIGVGQDENGSIEDVVDMRLQEVVDKIRGEGGGVVKLEVLKPDGTKRFVEIIRGVINLDDTKLKSTIFESGKSKSGKPCKIGFLRVIEFYQGLTGELKNELNKFKRNNVDVLVFDLSLSGGGSFQEIISTVGLFIETGPILQTKARNQKTAQVRNDSDPSIEWDGPIVVLSSKISSVEIFLEAMKDYHRAVIVGDSRSNGKPTMQQMKPLKEHAALGSIKLSIQTMYSPSGRSYCRGTEADIILPSTTEVQVRIESELDNWVAVEGIPPARQYPDFHLVTDDIVKSLKNKSADRIKKSKEFAALEKEIDKLKKAKARKSIPLSEKKFNEETTTNREDDMSKIISERQQAGSKIVKDYYLDEVLSIAVDCVNHLP